MFAHIQLGGFREAKMFLDCRRHILHPSALLCEYAEIRKNLRNNISRNSFPRTFVSLRLRRNCRVFREITDEPRLKTVTREDSPLTLTVVMICDWRDKKTVNNVNPKILTKNIYEYMIMSYGKNLTC